MTPFSIIVPGPSNTRAALIVLTDEPGLIDRERTVVFVKLVAVHFVPLLVERKTPPPSVPAKRFVPLTAKLII
jgi:hypothetical protein